MQRRLIEYIRRPDSLDMQAITQLHALIEKYPYYHTARILLLQALYKRHSPEFNKELRRTAPLIPNRQALFTLIEKKNYLADEERRKYGDSTLTFETSSDSTDHLIDNFLKAQPQENTNSSVPISAVTDYIGYLLQSEASANEKETTSATTEQDGTYNIIESYLNKGDVRIDINATTPEGPPAKQPDDEEQTEVMTETLAHIYIKQGKYEKAIEIIRRLSLKYPKKNRYFADQIRFMEKLIINNKNNKK